MDRLRDLSETDLAPEEGKAILRAAVREFPPPKYDWQDISESLIETLWKFPKNDYVSVVREEFHNYNPRAQFAALRLLTEAGTREALSALIDLMQQHARLGEIPDVMLVFLPLEREPRHPDVVFPRLLEFASIEKLAAPIYRLCLSYWEAKLLDPKVLEPFSSRIIEGWRKYDEKLRRMQRDSGVDWMWEDDYQSLRHGAGVILDLMGYMSADEVEDALRQVLEYKDPRLKLFAVLSLVRLGRDVQPGHIEDVAASSETRSWLYEKLKEMAKDRLFPARYRTQEALAESTLVDWLTFGTELARVPDEIELMRVFPIDTDDGVYDYYLFRFRSHHVDWKDQGWMPGTAGPFLREEEPTTNDHGGTFSGFEPWDSKTPEQHAEGIMEWLAQAAQLRQKKGRRSIPPDGAAEKT